MVVVVDAVNQFDGSDGADALQWLPGVLPPNVKVVFTSRNDRGLNGGGEAANSVTPPAIMAAFFDATGVMPRRIPLTPGYVKTLLNGARTTSKL